MGDFKERIGFEAGGRRLEDALVWARANGFHFVDFNADIGPNHLHEWSDQRVESVRRTAASARVELILHTLSGVNVAEFSPFVAPAVDQYLQANIRLAQRLGSSKMIVHAGYHFSSNEPQRKSVSLERLKRTALVAEKAGVTLLLENLNREPDDAEVHYLAFDVDGCRPYFEAIAGPAFGWAFTANHAHLVPEDFDGFLDAYGIERIGEVRLADCRGDKEEHLLPGEGTLDFRRLFRRLEDAGYRGHYSMAFGSDQDKLRARDLFAGMV
ncbi:MAG: sugar phosphate isomerase/epimerase [SAR202 cluster bacterium]|nr:sugar phosphate isomerase/epimerase [SAR202 cluster bacterium]